MKIVLMGTGPFAVPSFEAIRASNQDQIVLVITKPTPTVSGKMKIPSNPVLEWANQHSLRVDQPNSINTQSAIQTLDTFKPDLLVVCDYGQILNSQVLGSSRLGGINLHGSLLPKYRGAAPVQWSVLSGDRMAGITVIHMTPRLDGGPMLAQVSIPIESQETAGELEKRLSQLGVQATLESMDQLRACQSLADAIPLGHVQDPNAASKAPRLSKSDGQLDFRYRADIVQRQILGLQPWPGVYGQLILAPGKSVRAMLLKTNVVPGSWDTRQTADRSAGTLIWGETLSSLFRDVPSPSPLAILCKTQDGSADLLMVESLQLSGKNPLSSEEFLRGYSRNPGMQFELPESRNPLLEKLTSMIR